MPKRIEHCVTKLKEHGVKDDIAWGLCTNYHKEGRLNEDGSVKEKEGKTILTGRGKE